MATLSDFLQQFDLYGLADLLVSVAACLLCITIHELCHGFTACLLGDNTAKEQGRLSLNPIRHIDPLGLLLMVTVRVGWAKPVPVDTRNLRHPRRDMALISLAGPASNVLLSFLALVLAGVLYRHAEYSVPMQYLFYFLIDTAVVSIGLGLFNLLPVSPLDGSKILFAFLPDRIYGQILRWERYGMPVLFLLVFFGVFDRPLSICIYGALKLLCAAAQFPYSLFG